MYIKLIIDTIFWTLTQEHTRIMSRKCEVWPNGATKNVGTDRNF